MIMPWHRQDEEFALRDLSASPIGRNQSRSISDQYVSIASNIALICTSDGIQNCIVLSIRLATN